MRLTTTRSPGRQEATAAPLVRSGAAKPAAWTTFGQCVHAEWIKLRTMRSSLFIVLGTVAFCAGLATLNGSSAGADFAALTAEERSEFDPLATSLRGYLLAQIALGLLGGLAITSEYGARTIVGTLTSVPHRGRVLAAKAVVLAGL